MRGQALCSPDVMVLMTTKHRPPEVLTLIQARCQMSQTVSRFRREGITSEPIIFGHHRKPEAATIPYEMYEALLPDIDEVLLAATVRARLAGATTSWGEVLADLNISQEDVDAVELANFTTSSDAPPSASTREAWSENLPWTRSMEVDVRPAWGQL